MITALYRWAKFKAEADGITISPANFNSVMEQVYFGKPTPLDIDIVYNPIMHLFDLEPREDSDYSIILFDPNGSERNPTQNDMKFIMQPRRDLTGKAKQAIGGSLFWRNSLPKRTKQVGGTYKKDHKIEKTRRGKVKRSVIHVAKIPAKKLIDFQRYRLIDTYFSVIKGGEIRLRTGNKLCCFCGIEHRFDSIRFVPPINLFVENVSNFTPVLSGMTSHSLCPYCAMLFMRTAVEGMVPPQVRFFGAGRAYIYLLPYDSKSNLPYTRINIQIAEEILRSEFEKLKWKFSQMYALEYMLMLPILIFDALPFWSRGKVNPYLYIVFADHKGQAETIVDHALVTRLDLLARVGKQLKAGNWFQSIFDFRERLLSFVDKFRSDQRVNGYKILFRFLARVLSDGDIDFAFLHNILRDEISIKKRQGKYPHLTGFSYLNAFLKEVKRGRS